MRDIETMMKDLFLICIHKLWKNLSCISCLCLLFVILFTFDYYSDKPQALLYTCRLRKQNFSKCQYVKFQNLSWLIDACRQMTTIDCLNHLHRNQSDYFRRLSPSETRLFRKNYCTNKNRILFHTFWNDPHKLNEPLLILHILSYLYTQNHRCSQLIIWTLPMFYGEIHPMYNVHEPYVQFRTLRPFANDLKQVGADIDSYYFWLFDRWSVSKIVALSDAVRFVVLHKLGGVYIDADVLLLRDLQPFYEYEFAYQWSNRNEYNTAILRLFPQSNISSILIHQAYEKQSPTVFSPWVIRSLLIPIDLIRLPSVFFDPLWLVADNIDNKTVIAWKLSNNTRHTFESVIHKESYLSQQGRTVLNGAFSFHWHTLHVTGQIQPGSYLSQWNEYLQAELLELI
ncbi:unnamed protein product [Adineta ricciae]|uniref:Alpha-1,4-N-acetylglucosaminyltransferase n=1 Tax=Adineta ricciae TaxID=249248 RepID=A0A814REI0_ADIRI|nr:unnamed protein product [Adineta ricciae]